VQDDVMLGTSAKSSVIQFAFGMMHDPQAPHDAFE
jgi:hypothetical protein